MDPKILEKFFKGEASPDEVHQILIWINSPDSRKELEMQYDEFEETYDLDSKESEKIKEGILTKIREGQSKINTEHELIDRERIGSSFLSIKNWRKVVSAASIAICLFAFVLWKYEPFKDSKSQLSSEKPLTNVERSTGKGQKLTIKLGDGSEVKLNSESSIKFPEKFSQGKREVFLEGEAFFNVVPDSTSPFIVHTKSIQTRVLGTSFVVKENSDKSKAKVAVLTGKVQVSIHDSLAGINSEKIHLEAMDGVSINLIENSLQSIRVEYDEVFSWKDNVISFRNATFQEIVTRLESWYGVDFSVSKDFLTSEDYTGKFENQTLEEVLLGLSFIYDFDFTIKEKEVSVYSK